MPRRAVSPRNEQSRQDLWASHEIITGLPRQKHSRNDVMENAAHGSSLITVALTGTAISGGVTEEMLVNGSETLILTLTNDTWVSEVGANNAVTTALVAGITGPGAEAAGWNAQILAGATLDYTDVVRTNATTVTVTIPASASFALTADEVITVAVPASAVDNGITPVTSTFTITANVIIALTGTAVAGGVLESEIVTGSETVIITLTGDTWHATLGDDNAITTAFLAAITGDLADAAGWEAQMTLVHGNLVQTSTTIMTLTTPATAGYSITSGNETVTVAPTVDSVVGGIVPVVKTFVITEGS